MKKIVIRILIIALLALLLFPIPSKIEGTANLSFSPMIPLYKLTVYRPIDGAENTEEGATSGFMFELFGFPLFGKTTTISTADANEMPPFPRGTGEESNPAVLIPQ